jgi:branched-chain amino acid transport system permease protein
MGSTAGVVLGAFVVAFLPEYFRDLERYRVLGFGAALVILMIVRPQGLIPSRRRAAELHHAQTEESMGAATVAEAEAVAR